MCIRFMAMQSATAGMRHENSAQHNNYDDDDDANINDIVNDNRTKNVLRHGVETSETEKNTHGKMKKIKRIHAETPLEIV